MYKIYILYVIITERVFSLRQLYCYFCAASVQYRLTRSLSLWLVGVWVSWPCPHQGRGPSADPPPGPACLRSPSDAVTSALSCHFQCPGKHRQQIRCDWLIRLIRSFIQGPLWIDVKWCHHYYNKRVLTTSSSSSARRMFFSTWSAFVCIWAINKAKLLGEDLQEWGEGVRKGDRLNHKHWLIEQQLFWSWWIHFLNSSEYQDDTHETKRELNDAWGQFTS